MPEKNREGVIEDFQYLSKTIADGKEPDLKSHRSIKKNWLGNYFVESNYEVGGSIVRRFINFPSPDVDLDKIVITFTRKGLFATSRKVGQLVLMKELSTETLKEVFEERLNEEMKARVVKKKISDPIVGEKGVFLFVDVPSHLVVLFKDGKALGVYPAAVGGTLTKETLTPIGLYSLGPLEFKKPFTPPHKFQYQYETLWRQRVWGVTKDEKGILHMDYDSAWNLLGPIKAKVDGTPGSEKLVSRQIIDPTFMRDKEKFLADVFGGLERSIIEPMEVQTTLGCTCVFVGSYYLFEGDEKNLYSEDSFSAWKKGKIKRTQLNDGDSIKLKDGKIAQLKKRNNESYYWVTNDEGKEKIISFGEVAKNTDKKIVWMASDPDKSLFWKTIKEAQGQEQKIDFLVAHNVHYIQEREGSASIFILPNEYGASDIKKEIKFINSELNRKGYAPLDEKFLLNAWDKAKHEGIEIAEIQKRMKNIKGEWIAASGAGVEFPGDKTTIWVKLSETAKRVKDYAKKVTEEIQKYTEKKKPPLLTVAR